MSEVVSYARRGAVGVITIDNPPVNAMSHAVREGTIRALEQAAADGHARAVVLHCAGRTFVAGADISEFNAPPQPPVLPEVVQRIEDLDKPVIAAIHGTALGGGFEIALGCHYRCAVAGARVGLPEVTLGILPGASGTQRVPRLIGPRAALDLMISGKPVTAPEALALGLIDEVLDGEDPLEGGLAYAQRLVADGAPVRRIRDMAVDAAALPGDFFGEYRRAMAPRTRGYFAPERIVQCVEAAVSLPFEQGLARERELFEACRATTQSKALRYLFFAERAAAKAPGVGKDTARRPIERAVVVGAGTMGAGIAVNLVNAGIPVSVLEADAAALERGLGAIRRILESSVRKGRMSAGDLEARMAEVHGAADDRALFDADLVIEAVFEDMTLKREVFGHLDRACKPGAILATNTSTLDVDAIAAATGRAEDVIGLHFFSPAHVMPLLEVVRGGQSAPEVIATAMDLAKRLRKTAVLVGNCWGFVGNRMFGKMLRENQLMQLEGVPAERIDAAARDFGMAMGPNAVLDLAGLDVEARVRRAEPERPDDPAYCRVVDLLVERGRLGQKSGRGFFRYEAGSREPVPDPEVGELVRAEAARLGVEPRGIEDTEILERLFYLMINEGAGILEAGKAQRPGDIDVIWTSGYGFPRYRGGPMFYADTVGLDAVLAAIERLRARYGERDWTPAPLLVRLAGEGTGFTGA